MRLILSTSLAGPPAQLPRVTLIPVEFMMKGSHTPMKAAWQPLIWGLETYQTAKAQAIAWGEAQTEKNLT